MPKIPSAQVADQIEAKLKTVPCVGSLHRWERHYEFASEPSSVALLLTLGTSNRWFNYRKARISYYQAGFEGYRPMRVRESGFVGARLDTDDRAYDLVLGDYSLTTEKGSLWASGSNWGGGEPLS